MRCSVNATSVFPAASPLHPASVSLPALRGLADTSRFQEPPALPTSALSGSPTGLSLPSHLFRLLLYCSLLASAQSAGSPFRTLPPTLPRRIFRCLVPGMSLTVLVYWTQVELYQSNRKRTYTYPGRDGVALTVLGSIAAPDIRLSSSCPGDPIGNVGAGRYARPLITSKRGSSVPR